jgi:hypothetical protein
MRARVNRNAFDKQGGIMKRVLTGLFFVGLALTVATAQDNPTASPSPASPPSASPSPQRSPTQTAPTPAPQSLAPQTSASAQPQHVTKIAPGSVIPVSLTKTIDAKKAKTGDEVVAKVTQDMKSTTGEVIVAKDTKMVGHVTESQPRSKDQKESQVAIAFDKEVTKDGNEMQMPMSIQAVVAPQNNATPSGSNTSTGTSEAPSPSTSTGSNGRAGMGGSTPPPTAPSSNSGEASNNSQGANPRPAINAQTQGVIGLSNVTLAAASNPGQGSVLTSDKNNVKIEGGTMLLLRVN